MNFRLSLLAGTALIGVAAFAPQQASAAFVPTPGAPCPTVTGAGGTTSCGAIITLNSNGTTTITHPGSGPYDGNDDTAIGVVNNSGGPVGSITLSGSDIFGFDGDGIGTNNYYGDFATQTGDSTDSTGYGGPDNTFAIVDSNNGSVIFTTPLANGSATFFSLEENLSQAGFTVTTVTSTPEPASLALFGGGLAALGALRRRKKA